MLLYKKYLHISICFLIFGCNNEHRESTPKLSHSESLVDTSGVERPYQLFSKAYESLNLELLRNAYGKDALLVNMYEGQGPSSIQGRQKISTFFASNFESAQLEGKRLSIEFKVIDRQILNEQVLDNGYYKLEVFSGEIFEITRYGKFSIALQKESGEWKFFVDVNGSAIRDDFERQ